MFSKLLGKNKEKNYEIINGKKYFKSDRKYYPANKDACYLYSSDMVVNVGFNLFNFNINAKNTYELLDSKVYIIVCINKNERKDIDPSIQNDVSENKLGSHNYFSPDTTYKNVPDDRTFLDWLFTKVLEFQTITYKSTEYNLIPDNADINRKTFQDVTKYDLYGMLVAGTCICYKAEKFGIGFIVDSVMNNNKTISSCVNIAYDGGILPDNVLETCISWIITCDGSAYPGREGAKLKDAKNAGILDESKAQYGRVIPNNKSICANQTVELYAVKPRNFETKLPTQDMLPDTLMENSNNKNFNLGGYVTGYFYVYNLIDGTDLTSNIKLDLVYVRFPITVSGQPDTLTLANLIQYENDTVTILGNCINVLQIPRFSEFFQTNFGDSMTSLEETSDIHVFYPTVYWEMYNQTELE